MGAVVEQDENSDEDGRRHHRQCERGGVGITLFDRKNHQCDDDKIEAERTEKLPGGNTGIGGVFGEFLVPGGFFRM